MAKTLLPALAVSSGYSPDSSLDGVLTFSSTIEATEPVYAALEFLDLKRIDEDIGLAGSKVRWQLDMKSKERKNGIRLTPAEIGRLGLVRA